MEKCQYDHELLCGTLIVASPMSALLLVCRGSGQRWTIFRKITCNADRWRNHKCKIIGFFQIEALHTCAVCTSLLSRFNKGLHIWEVPGLGIGPAVGYIGDIQDVSWVVDITVHDYFLGVCVQNVPFNMGPTLMLLCCVYFLILVNALQCSALATFRVHLNAVQSWTARKWCRFQYYLCSIHNWAVRYVAA